MWQPPKQNRVKQQIYVYTLCNRKIKKTVRYKYIVQSLKYLTSNIEIIKNTVLILLHHFM